MITALLTPLMLATTPVTIQVPALTYDHSAQTSTGVMQVTGTMHSSTFNGTQTFSPNGQPFDADQDSDVDPMMG